MDLPIPAVPYVNYLRRRLFGNISLKSVAERQEILCRPAAFKVPRPVFLPGQLDRVTGTDVDASLEAELHCATTDVWSPLPTTAYHIKDALLIDGSIYKGRFKSFVAARTVFDRSLRNSEVGHLEVAGLASSQLGSRYFGHWLIDDCIQYEIAREYARPLCVRNSIYPEHQTKYQGLFGQDWTPVDRARIDHLVVYQNYHWGTAQDELRSGRFRSLRRGVQASLSSSVGGALIYLSRGRSGSRRMIRNEEKLQQDLSQSGFTCIDFEAISLDELLGVLATAKIVVSIEGSHAAHCAYAVPERSGFVALQPADRFLSLHRGWSTSAGVQFGFVVGTMDDRQYSFSSSEILSTVDLMLKRVENLAVV